MAPIKSQLEAHMNLSVNCVYFMVFLLNFLKNICCSSVGYTYSTTPLDYFRTPLFLLWSRVVPCVSMWFRVCPCGVCGYMCVHLGTCVPVWVLCMCVWEHVYVCMGTHGHVWLSMLCRLFTLTGTCSP